MHHVVTAKLAAARAGTHDTKTRKDVRGGGKKPFRQKGTGRARMGTSRSPLLRGGGTVFGPHPRKYDGKVNRKEMKAALRSALSAQGARGQDRSRGRPLPPVCEDEGIPQGRVRARPSRCADRHRREPENLALGARNLKAFKILPAKALNVYDILSYDQLS